MCYFITIGVPPEHGETLRRLVPRGLRVEPSQNTSIAKAVGDGHGLFVITSGGCSCGLYRSAPDGDAYDDIREREARLRKKYANKGWTDAKIQRAIGSAHPVASSGFVGLRDDACALLAQLAREAGRVGVVVHFYSGRVEDETIHLGAVQSMTAAAIECGEQVISPDTLTWVQCEP